MIPVARPYRLDLTTAVLRRFSTNAVDVLARDGTYVRALGAFASPAVVAVRQSGPASLAVRIAGAGGEEARALALVRRMLGTDRSVPVFDGAAERVPWLRELARRMRGVKPPRYPTLWEAATNAIVFQQVSLVAASAILRRTIEALGESVRYAEVELHAFPPPEAFLAAPDAALRAAGLSAAKIATLRRVADALASGALDEGMLEERSSPDAAALLCTIKGIGPWTAAVVLLRGLGRLDVFPQNDSGVARTAAALAGTDVDVGSALHALGLERGMLYYHFLLARLEARGEIVASFRGLSKGNDGGMHDKSPETLTVTSSNFSEGATLPMSMVFNAMGCSGENRSPHLTWSNVPEGTQSFAIVAHDPDAPTGVGFFHWVVAGIPADVRELPEGAGDGSALPPGAVSGVSDFGAPGYGGPCPPEGDSPHHYEFTVYALKSKPGVDATTSGAKMRFMTRGNILASGTLTGLYGR